MFVAFLSLCVSAISAFSQSLDSDFTFNLPAGRKECFYQSMKKDASLEIEYQVHYIIRYFKAPPVQIFNTMCKPDFRHFTLT